MNPVAKLEASARTVWRSDLPRDEKAKRLKAVRKAILHYMGRLDGSAGEPWAARSLDRARSYLRQLAADVEELSLECERPAASVA